MDTKISVSGKLSWWQYIVCFLVGVWILNSCSRNSAAGYRMLITPETNLSDYVLYSLVYWPYALAFFFLIFFMFLTLNKWIREVRAKKAGLPIQRDIVGRVFFVTTFFCVSLVLAVYLFPAVDQYKSQRLAPYPAGDWYASDYAPTNNVNTKMITNSVAAPDFWDAYTVPLSAQSKADIRQYYIDQLGHIYLINILVDSPLSLVATTTNSNFTRKIQIDYLNGTDSGLLLILYYK